MNNYVSCTSTTYNTIYATNTSGTSETVCLCDYDRLKVRNAIDVMSKALAKPITDMVIHVHVYNNRVVKCEFKDGTTQKAVLHDEDTFDLEVGIGICITKHLLEKKACGKSGTYLYNKAIKHALKTMEDDKAVEKAKEEEAERVKNIRKKKEAKKRRREEERMRKFARILGEQLNGKSDN